MIAPVSTDLGRRVMLDRGPADPMFGRLVRLFAPAEGGGYTLAFVAYDGFDADPVKTRLDALSWAADTTP